MRKKISSLREYDVILLQIFFTWNDLKNKLQTLIILHKILQTKKEAYYYGILHWKCFVRTMKDFSLREMKFWSFQKRLLGFGTFLALKHHKNSSKYENVNCQLMSFENHVCWFHVKSEWQKITFHTLSVSTWYLSKYENCALLLPCIFWGNSSFCWTQESDVNLCRPNFLEREAWRKDQHRNSQHQPPTLDHSVQIVKIYFH